MEYNNVPDGTSTTSVDTGSPASNSDTGSKADNNASRDYGSKKNDGILSGSTNKNVEMDSKSFNPSSLVGLTESEKQGLKTIFGYTGLVYGGSLVIGEFFALATLAPAIGFLATSAVIGTALALPFAIISVGAGVYGLSTLLLGNQDTQTKNNLDSLQFVSNPIQPFGYIISDMIGNTKSESISYGKMLSSVNTLSGVKDLKKIDKLNYTFKAYESIDAIDTIEKEYKNLQLEVIGIEKTKNGSLKR